MILPTASLFLIFVADAGAADAGPAKLAAAPEDVLARVDALHRRRDEKAAFAEERRLLDAALARAPARYEVLWRAARASFWDSDDPGASHEERSRAGKVGWELAERAIVANGARPEGYYFAAVNMGSYALGLGLVKALTLGLEGKFKDRLGRAGQLAPGFEFGAIDIVWGRFYELLPWPKRDRNEAEKHYRRVLTLLNPASLRARVFLAETLAAEDRAPEARTLLEQVAAARPGAYDAPEERRAKALGAALMPAVMKAAR